MAFFQVIALFIFILALAWMFRVRFVEAVPVAVSVQVLLLYALCFGNRLWLWDYISVATFAVTVFGLSRLPGTRRAELTGFVKKELFDAGTLTAVALTVAVTFGVGDKPVSWWDDYNFWAADVKSIFYLDGFAEKYANVAAEFGDYPPGTQMMKWWFLHFFPGEFREGLMFAGYYFMNMSFLFPFLKYLKKRNPFLMLFGGILIWMFPSVAEAFWMDGCCADLTMAVAYGAFLVSVVDDDNGNSLWYYGRQALYLMIVVLCKNTGFIWMAFGLLFTYGYHIFIRKKKVRAKENKKAEWKGLAFVTLLPAALWGSWLCFCLMMRRVAKLTGTAIRMATGEMNLPAYQGTMVKAFLEAFLRWPLHRSKTFAVDLSPLALYLLLVLGVIFLWKAHLLEKREAGCFGVFLALSGAVFYMFNLISHLTIFAVETQYLEPFGMVSSIERYGAPFMVGGMCFLSYFLLKRGKRVGKIGISVGAVVCAGFILLTADYAGSYRGLFGYRGQVSEILAQRDEVVDEAAQRFLEQIGAGKKESIGRVLYLRDLSDVSWVRNTYIGFEASPVSVMYGNIDTESFTEADLVRAVTDAHADFLYVDELCGDANGVFEEFLNGQKMEYGCLYQVTFHDANAGAGNTNTDIAGIGMEMRKYERN